MGLAVGLAAAPAKAAPIVYIELLEAGFSPLILSSPTGQVVFTGTYGNYTFNNTTGLGQPFLPPSLGIDLNSVNVKSGAAGALTIRISETGATNVPSDKLFRGNIGGTFDGAVSSLAYSVYVDSTNTAFGMQQQIGTTATFLASPFSGTVQGTATGLSGPFSMTEQVVINTTSGDALVSLDAHLSPVPLPDTAPLFGAALFGLGVVGYGVKRKRQTAPAA